jgi:hypothetical protein
MVQVGSVVQFLTSAPQIASLHCSESVSLDELMNMKRMLSILCVPALLLGCYAAQRCPVRAAVSSPPGASQPTSRTIAADLALQRQLTKKRDIEVLKTRYGVDVELELGRIRDLQASADPKQLWELVRHYDRLATDTYDRAVKTQRPGIPVTIYLLPCAAFEALVARVGLTSIPAGERLAYANWLAKLDAIPVTPERTASAYEDVLKAKPTASQECEALLGRQQALILAEQQAPGKYIGAILEIVDTLRTKAPMTVTFRQALERTGDCYLWHGNTEEAKRYFVEALHTFGEAAVIARRRLEQLNQ